MQTDLYIYNKRKYLKEDSTCNVCQKKLIEDGIGVVLIEWKKKKSRMRYHCIKCWKSVKTFGEIIEEFSAVVKEIPSSAKPYLPKPPSVKSGYDVSVFDVAQIDKLGGKTVDNTIRANREVPKIIPYEIKEDRLIELDDVDDFLEELR